MTINFSSNNIYQKFFQKAGIIIPQNTQTNNAIPTIKIGDINEPENRKKLFGIIGISAGTVLLLGIITLFTLSKGLSGSIAKKLKDISEIAKKQIYDLSVQSKELTNFQKIQLKISKIVQHTADAMQATSNISAIKDSFVQHWINKLHINNLVNKINQVFKNIVLKTKNNAYQSAEYSVIDFCNYLKKIAKENINSPYSKNLEEKANKILNLYMQNFSSAKHINRTNQFWENTIGLDKKVYEILYKPKGGIFKNLKRFRSYITTDLVEQKRKTLINPIIKAKKEISNSIKDVNSDIKQALFNLKTTINTKNNKSVNIIKEITEILNSNKAINGINEQKSRKELFEIIKIKLNELSQIVEETTQVKESLNITKEKITELKNILEFNVYKKGQAQEAITEIKKMFETAGGKNSPEYKQAVKLLSNMNKKLNTAIESESIAYEKLAELQVGSAPTDILGILVPTAIGTAMVVNADDKHERISSTLTKGIPILGGVGVSYYGTTRGFTGFKNLALSLITGYLLNILGNETDKFVKNHMKEQEKLKKAFEAFTKMQKTNTKSEKQVKANNSTK